MRPPYPDLVFYRRALTAADEARIDELALQTSGVDPFCSSSRWIVPAHRHFHASGRPYVFELSSGLAAFQLHVAETGVRMLLPLESSWHLGCPVLTRSPEDTYPELLSALSRTRSSWDACVISGLETGCASELALGRAADPARVRRFQLPDVHREVIDLVDGVDGWLAARRRSFRRNLRRATRQADEAGVTFERLVPSASDASAHFDRFLEIEATSWKGASQTGISTEPMRGFCREVFERCAQAGEARVIIARARDVDVGFLYGSVLRDTFRGLQMSYAQSHRGISLGSLMQLDALHWMDARRIRHYDLGSAMEYKERWSNHRVSTRTQLLLS